MSLRYLHFIPALVVASIILSLSFLPGPKMPPMDFMGVLTDKILHFAAYFTQAVCLIYGIAMQTASSNQLKLPIWLPLIGLILFGVLIEIVQGLWIIQRNFDFYDIMANSFGALLGILLSKFLFLTFLKK